MYHLKKNKNQIILEGLQSYIEVSTLEEFKLCKDNVEWTGLCDNKNLFYIWRNRQNALTYNCTSVKSASEEFEETISNLS